MDPWKVDGVGTNTAGPSNTDTHSVRVTITTAQVLALFTTPITLVAAPGSGKVLQFVSAHLWLDYNSIAYDGVAGGEDLAISYTDASGEEVARVEATGFIDQAADEHRFIYAQTAALDSVTTIEPVANAALVLHMLSGNIATGNSPLKVEVIYRTLPYTW